jgi:DNA sulfur modification protein DndD
VSEILIERIVLKNYRCYKDAEINFLESNINLDSPGITLFTGDNTVGKTTIFNAIGWILYGRETQSMLKRQEQTLPIASTSSFKDSNSSEVKAELHIAEIGEIKKAIITRTAKFNKQSTDPFDTELTFILRYKDGTEKLLSSITDRGAVAYLLKQLFPSEIAAFHLFDGEFLELTYTNKGGNIEAGIKNLFRIRRIEELREQSKELREWYGKERSKYTQNSVLQEKMKLQIETQKKLDQVSDEINEIGEYIIELDKEIESTKSTLESLGDMDSIKEKKDHLSRVETEIKQLESRKRTETDERRKLIFKNAYKLNGYGIYEKVSNLLSEYTEKGKIPPEIKDKFVNDLLKRGRCICGADLSQENSYKHTVEELLREISGSSEREVLLDIYYASGNTVERIKSLKNEIGAKEKTIQEIGRSLSKYNVERSELMEYLKENSSYDELIDQFITLKDNERRCDDQKGRLDSALRIKKTEHWELDSQISGLRRDISRLAERNERYKEYSGYYEKAELLTNIFNSIVKNILSEIAKRYDEKVNELIKLVPILSNFKVEIGIAETGKMTFKFLQDGNQQFYMAGGQNQLMGILLIAAFTKVMRKNTSEDISAPFVVIDNPVSTLSRENIALFGKILGDLFDGVHLILFTKNTDYEEILKGGHDKIRKFYKLNKNKDSENTEINEVI